MATDVVVFSKKDKKLFRHADDGLLDPLTTVFLFRRPDDDLLGTLTTAC